MARLRIFGGLVVVAILAAALFGALHNQVSYTVGPTYFTEFKFFQFRVGTQEAPRFGAAVVGVKATWWMGAILALPAMSIGALRIGDIAVFRAAGLRAIATVIVTAAVCAGLGLVVGGVAVNMGVSGVLTVPPGGIEADFIRAGAMHDGAYAGGAIGGILAVIKMWKAKGVAR